MRRRRGRRLRLVLVIAFAAAGALWGFYLSRMHVRAEATLLDRIEAIALDLRHLATGRSAPPDEVVIVAIDDAAVARFGSFPVPRRDVAALVERLHAAGARAVAVDLLFLEPSANPEDDRALARALGGGPAVVGAAARFDGGAREDAPATQRPDLIPFAEAALWPIPAIGNAARIGLVNVSPDPFGTPRHVPLLVAVGETLTPSFVIAAASAATAGDPVITPDAVLIGDVRQPLDRGRHLAIRYYGPRGTIPTLGAVDVLSDGFDAARVRGRIAVIGVTAVGGGDTFATPFAGNVPGVEVLATAIANLVRGEGLDRGERVRAIDFGAAIALPVIAVLALASRRTLVGLAIVAFSLAAWVLVAFAAFASGVWLSVAVPLAAALPVALAFGAVSYAIERGSARRLEERSGHLERLQSPVIAARIADDPDFLEHPVSQSGCVLFFDVNGFTGFAESAGPEATRRFQSELVALAQREATPRGGALTTFMGDGAMIVFGLPDPREDDARRALETLVALDEALARWLAGWSVGRTRTLTARFGLHRGTIVASRLGEEAQQTVVTVTGDTVNVASRLMEVARANGRRMAVGETVFEDLGDAGRDALAFRFGPPLAVEVRGRARPVTVRCEA